MIETPVQLGDPEPPSPTGAAPRRARVRSMARLLGPGVQMPTFVMMFVTNRCDAKCPHCFYHDSLNTNATKELKLHEYEALTRSLGPVLHVTLTGGSPELRPDLARIAECFSRNCRPSNITICVNGYHVDRILGHVRDILETCPDQGLTVSVSLDGVGDAHSEFRGMPGLFERDLATFEGLAALKREHPNLRVQCGMVVNGLNYETIEDAANWVWDNVPIDYLKLTLVRSVPPPPDEKTLDENCTREYLRLIDGDTDRWMRPVGVQGTPARAIPAMAKEVVLRQIFRERLDGGECPVRCGASRENITIYPDGTVAGCECRPEIIGDLRSCEMNAREVWFGTHAAEFREVLGREGCANHHHGYLALPIFRTPRMWPRLARAAVAVRFGRRNRSARAASTGQ